MINKFIKIILIFILFALSAYPVLATEEQNTEGDVVTYINMGDLYYISKEYEMAIENYNKAIELDPNYIEAYIGRGLTYSALKEFDKAIEDFNKAIELDPNNAKAYNNRGVVYYDLKQYDKALKDYNMAIKLNPYYNEAYIGRGLTYSALKEFDKAIEDFNKTIEINQDNIKAYYGRGFAYYQLGQYDKAIEDFNKAIELNSSFTEAYYGRGLAYLGSGQYDKAIEDFNKAIELNQNYTNNSILLCYRGLAYYQLGQYDKAIEDCDKVIELNRDKGLKTLAYFIRARSYHDLKQYDKAIEDFNKAIELNSSFTEAYYGRGLAYLGSGQYDKAIEDFNKVIELDPNYIEAYHYKEMAKERLKEMIRAKIKPPISIFLAILPLFGAIFNNIWDKKKKSKKIKIIESWKVNILAIGFFITGFWGFYLGAKFALLNIKTSYILLKYGGVVVSTIFCLITVKILLNSFIHHELSKIYSFYNIAFSLSCTLFASFAFLDLFYFHLFYFPHTIIEVIFVNTILIAIPLSIPNLVSLYITKKYGDILMVEGMEAKIPTTPVFPADLHQYYSDAKYIGGGGFGWVFQATRKDGKKVAIKIPAIKDEKTGAFFLREVANWSALEHENIVKLYSFNIFPVPYLEMELCDGSLGFGKRDLKEAISIIYEVAKGLKHAHEKKIVHADIKHANILIKDGKIKISDWGLSKVKRGKSLSISALTPEYAAPEQIHGRIDERTDIWQLGVVFYELVTGKLPFEGEDTDVLNHVINDEPVPPSEKNPDSKCVEHIIMKCLSKRKEERYQSVDELLGELESYKPEGETTLSNEKEGERETVKIRFAHPSKSSEAI